MITDFGRWVTVGPIFVVIHRLEIEKLVSRSINVRSRKILAINTQNLHLMRSLSIEFYWLFSCFFVIHAILPCLSLHSSFVWHRAMMLRVRFLNISGISHFATEICLTINTWFRLDLFFDVQILTKLKLRDRNKTYVRFF